MWLAKLNCSIFFGVENRYLGFAYVAYVTFSFVI